MPRVVHFEIYADQPERSIKFYQDVFGWEVHKWDGPEDYWLVITGDQNAPGIDGAIMARPESGAIGMNFIDVPAIDEYLAKVESAGGSVTRPKMPIPGVGYAATCLDTEGNPIGLFQSDPDAA